MPGGRARSTRPRRLRTLLGCVLGGLVALATLETGLRLLRPLHTGVRGLLYQSTLPTDYERVADLPALLGTTVLGYGPLTEQEHYVLNSRGLRTREYEDTPTAGTLRVVALGDSFTFGGVPDAAHWCPRLEARMAEHRGAPVEVLRLGVPGTGPPFHLRMWELEGARLRAEVVVVALFVGNDFFDEQGRRPGWRGLVDRGSAASYAVRLARNLARLDPTALGGGTRGARRTFAAGGYELEGRAASFDDTRPTFSESAFAEIQGDRMALCLNASRLAFAIRLERVMRVLRELTASVRASGARLVVMVISDEYQVSSEVASGAARAEGRALADYDLERPQRALVEALDGDGIETVDLLAAFRSRSGRERLYVPRDTHWNRAGHDLASAELAAALHAPVPSGAP
jgi:hypothetical protein